MRIVSGKYKGRKLEGYDIKGTRPTMDRVKESLFAMIQEKVPGSCCLDLFAGSGNLGFEALSQGALFVTFVDYNEKAIQTIRHNKNLLKVEDVAIYKADFKKALTMLADQSFDLIFLDPPYDTSYLQEALNYIKKYQLLKRDGYLILESNQQEKLQIPATFEEVKRRKYGDKFISIVKNK